MSNARGNALTEASGGAGNYIELEKRALPHTSQDRRRRASDSLVASTVASAAHAASTLALILLLGVAVKLQISWVLWCQVVAGSLLFHSTISRLVSGKTFARWILPSRLKETLNQIPDGLLLTDNEDRIVMANDVFLQSIGMSQKDLIGRAAGSLPWVCGKETSHEDLPWVYNGNQKRAQGEQLMQYRLPDGNMRLFAIKSSPVNTDQEDCKGALVTLRDVTQVEGRRAELEQMLVMLRSSRDEMSSLNRELTVLASEDPLTGCLNRRSFFEQCERVWGKSLVDDSPLAILMLDVDHFKQVNDLFGHQVGDEVLRVVSAVLRKKFTPPSMVGRYGGEEFCVMVPGADIGLATQYADFVRKQIEGAEFPSEPDLRLSVSVGVSVRAAGVKQLDDLVRQADECLYLAKNSGRNCVMNRKMFLLSLEEQAGKRGVC